MPITVYLSTYSFILVHLIPVCLWFVFFSTAESIFSKAITSLSASFWLISRFILQSLVIIIVIIHTISLSLFSHICVCFHFNNLPPLQLLGVFPCGLVVNIMSSSLVLIIFFFVFPKCHFLWPISRHPRSSFLSSSHFLLLFLKSLLQISPRFYYLFLFVNHVYSILTLTLWLRFWLDFIFYVYIF